MDVPAAAGRGGKTSPPPLADERNEENTMRLTIKFPRSSFDFQNDELGAF